MFDLNRTIQLITGALFDREATWRSYLPEAGNWQKTAFQLTGPLIVASAIVAYLLSLVFDSSTIFSMVRPTLRSTAFGIVMGAIGAGIISFIFSALAGTFGGKNNFALGLAGITLAFVPGYFGQALTWLPWIGRWLALGLGIFSLVQLWKIIPIYLEVPDGKRATHYIVSLIATIVVMVVIGTVVSRLVLTPSVGSPFSSMSGAATSEQPSGGMFGDAVRRGELMEEAMKDTYTPPADGRLTEKQVRAYASVVQRVTKLQEEAAVRMRDLAEKVDNDGEASIKDLGAIMNGANEAGRLATSEMEMVKEDGGNWAEHGWVAKTLLTASRQKDTNDAVAHNYALYEKFKDQLETTKR
jgi:hypothetical protein